MHLENVALHENMGDDIPAEVAFADRLLLTPDVVDPAGTGAALEEELAVEELLDSMEELSDSEQDAACGSVTPALTNKKVRTIGHLKLETLYPVEAPWIQTFYKDHQPFQW